ncbi:MAG: hypothetical protein ACMUIS_11100 [bacterium]
MRAIRILKENHTHPCIQTKHVCALLCIILCLYGRAAFGQLPPYAPYVQNPLPLLTNLTINPAAQSGVYARSFSPFAWINPALSLYNPWTSFGGYGVVDRSFWYPQASIAGSLAPFASTLASPFASPFVSPFASPYSAAALYYAAAVTADVSGAWTGVWTSTYLAGGVTTGDLSITLVQSGTTVTGTVAFFLNKILKFGADVAGSVDVNTLTLTSTVIPSAGGTKSFDVTITATVTDTSMKGTYIAINNVTGNIAEEGTFTATRL